MLRNALLVLAGAGLLAGCGGETYPLSAKAARSKLVGMQPPLMIFGSGAASARSSQYGDGTVRWVVLDTEGLEVIRFVATIEDAGENRARVKVAMEPPQGSRRAKVAQGMDENPAIVNLFRKAMAEQVDAKLENRSFDMRVIQGEMMAATIATMPKMQADALQAAHDMEQMTREMERSGSGFQDDAAIRQSLADDLGTDPSAPE